MTLGELIDYLENHNPELKLAMGLGDAHSYRGYYEQLAFELEPSVTVEKMLKTAKSCLGKTFTGYKGGEFTMDHDTDTWIAAYNSTGSEITYGLLDQLFRHAEAK